MDTTHAQTMTGSRDVLSEFNDADTDMENVIDIIARLLEDDELNGRTGQLRYMVDRITELHADLHDIFCFTFGLDKYRGQGRAAENASIGAISQSGDADRSAHPPKDCTDIGPGNLAVLRAEIEAGTIPFDAPLIDAKGQWCASIMPDGSIISGLHRGSIHQVAANLRGVPFCNGWKFWHIVRDGRLVPLESLRRHRSNMPGDIEPATDASKPSNGL